MSEIGQEKRGVQRQPGVGTSGREPCEKVRLALPCRQGTPAAQVNAKWMNILVRRDHRPVSFPYSSLSIHFLGAG